MKILKELVIIHGSQACFGKKLYFDNVKIFNKNQFNFLRFLKIGELYIRRRKEVHKGGSIHIYT